MEVFINNLRKHDNLTLIIYTIIYELLAFILNTYSLFYLISIIYAVGIFILLFDKKDYSKNIFHLIYIIGIVIRTHYIIETNVYTRQHDVAELNGEGHLGYIYTLYKTYALPKSLHNQFYHPPLWHIMAAIVLKFMVFLVSSIGEAAEGIQILSLLFSQMMIVVVDKICHKLKFSDKYRLITDLLFAVHPTLILFSGSINNDCLLTFLELLIILLLINWYQLPSWKNTILLAIATGLCVMTKANGAVMAIPILFIFICKFIEYFKKDKSFKSLFKSFISKIIIFGLISLPIGLWFQVKSIIDFGHLPKIPAMIFVDNGHSFKERFYTLKLEELIENRTVNVTSDVNLPSFTIKSSIFGEYIYNINDTLKLFMIFLNLTLICLSIIFTIRYFFTKNKHKEIIAILITGIIYLAAMYQFNYYYPYNCSMDFRYIAITLLPGILIITYTLNNIKNKYLKIPIDILLFIFTITSIYIMYHV